MANARAIEAHAAVANRLHRGQKIVGPPCDGPAASLSSVLEAVSTLGRVKLRSEMVNRMDDLEAGAIDELTWKVRHL